MISGVPSGPDPDNLQNDVYDESVSFNQVIVLESRIELDVILCALDDFIQTCASIEMQEVARDMRRSIANDAGF